MKHFHRYSTETRDKTCLRFDTTRNPGNCFHSSWLSCTRFNWLSMKPIGPSGECYYIFLRGIDAARSEIWNQLLVTNVVYDSVEVIAGLKPHLNNTESAMTALPTIGEQTCSPPRRPNASNIVRLIDSRKLRFSAIRLDGIGLLSRWDCLRDFIRHCSAVWSRGWVKHWRRTSSCLFLLKLATTKNWILVHW